MGRKKNTIHVDIELTKEQEAQLKKIARHEGRTKRNMAQRLLHAILEGRQLADYSSLF